MPTFIARIKTHVKLASYLISENNPSPALSSQSIRLEMTDAGILDPLMHLFFAKDIDMANLVLMNKIVWIHGLAQSAARFPPNLLKKMSASLPSSP